MSPLLLWLVVVVVVAWAPLQSECWYFHPPHPVPLLPVLSPHSQQGHRYAPYYARYRLVAEPPSSSAGDPSALLTAPAPVEQDHHHETQAVVITASGTTKDGAGPTIPLLVPGGSQASVASAQALATAPGTTSQPPATTEVKEAPAAPAAPTAPTAPEGKVQERPASRCTCLTPEGDKLLVHFIVDTLEASLEKVHLRDKGQVPPEPPTQQPIKVEPGCL